MSQSSAQIWSEEGYTGVASTSEHEDVVHHVPEGVFGNLVFQISHSPMLLYDDQLHQMASTLLSRILITTLLGDIERLV